MSFFGDLSNMLGKLTAESNPTTKASAPKPQRPRPNKPNMSKDTIEEKLKIVRQEKKVLQEERKLLDQLEKANKPGGRSNFNKGNAGQTQNTTKGPRPKANQTNQVKTETVNITVVKTVKATNTTRKTTAKPKN